MAFGGNKGDGRSTRPVFALVKMEALWGINIVYAKNATKIVRRFIKMLPKLPEKLYEPCYTGTTGFVLSLISLSIEDSLHSPEIQGSYPDW